MTSYEFIQNSLQQNNTILTVTEFVQRFPQYTRPTAVNIFRQFAENSSSGVFYINGRKGYPSRLQRGNPVFALVLQDLHPDTEGDGPTIPKDSPVVVHTRDGESFQISWDGNYTWAGEEELEFLQPVSL